MKLNRAISDEDLHRLVEQYGSLDDIPMSAIDAVESASAKVGELAKKMAPVDFTKQNEPVIQGLVDTLRKKNDVYELNVPIGKFVPQIDESGGFSDILSAAGDKFPPPVTYFNPSTGKFDLKDGDHRLAYFKDNGYTHVPAIVVDKKGNLKDISTLNRALDLTPAEIQANKELSKKILNDVLNQNKETKDFIRLTRPATEHGLEVGFNDGKKQNGLMPLSHGQIFDLPNVTKAMDKIQLGAATKALKTTRADLLEVLKLSITRGDGAKDLAASISDKFNLPYMGNRSLLIARTEGTGILNSGTMLGFEQDGVSRKKWRATLASSRTRESHRQTHIETFDNPIPLEDEFDVGESSGMYPGDQMLSIEERANCRCALVTADFDGIRCRYYDRLFLRDHSLLEKELKHAVALYFGRMKSRIMAGLPSAPFYEKTT